MELSSLWDVVVIGGGAAGVSAARGLARSGRRVLILEARGRTGGRIHTHRETRISAPIELGAEFVHGLPDETWSEIRARSLGFAEIPDRHSYSIQRSSRDEIVLLPHFWQDLGQVTKRLNPGLREDRSFAAFLDSIHLEPGLRRFVPLARSYVEGFHGADARFISEKSLAEAESELGSDGSRRVFRLTGGYDQLVNGLLGDAQAAGCELRLNTVAHRIAWKPGEAAIHLVSRAGYGLPTVRARKVVLTLPIALLQAHLGSEGAIEFSPGLPEIKQESLKRLRMGPVTKIILRFRRRFWLDQPPGARFTGEDPAKLSFLHCGLPIGFPTWWTSLPSEAPILTGWTGGPGSLALSSRSEEAMVQEAIQSLATALSFPQAMIEEQLDGWHFHDWQADPYSRGAYSYVGVGGENARRELAEPVSDTLYFAGEATHFEGQSGTVDGALASGLRVAREIDGEADRTRLAS